jgi:ribokinase
MRLQFFPAFGYNLVNMNKNIVVFGSINYDIVAAAERLPAKGETVRGFGLETYTGGKGANQSVQTALLGLPTKFIGMVGDDEQGQSVLAGIKSKGVDAGAVSVAEGSTGCAIITVAEDGSNTIVHTPGANKKIGPQTAEKYKSHIENAAVLIAQTEVTLEAVQKALQIAHDAGVATLLNPAPAVPLDDALFPLLDYIVPNETESAQYTGIQCDGMSAEEWRKANAHWFLERGVKNVCITLGADGAYWTNGAHEYYTAPFPVKALDTTAAGDSFIGGLAYGIAHGWTIEKTFSLANACGAVAVTAKGAQNSIGDLSAIKAFLERFNVTLF